MLKVAVSAMIAIAVISGGGLPQEARADGATYTKKVRPITHARKCGPFDRCGFPVSCPSGMCYSLYSAYPPYGGAVFWSRYSYGGWGYR
jgi:hypothetical protein